MRLEPVAWSSFVAIVLLSLIPAVAEVPDVGPGVCVGGCEEPTRPEPWRIERTPVEGIRTPKPPKPTPEQLRQQKANQLYRQGYDLWQQGNRLAAETYFVQAFKTDPNGEGGNIRAGYCAIKKNLSQDFLNQKNYAKALQYQQDASGACPNDTSIQGNIGLIQHHMAYNQFQNQKKISTEKINDYLGEFTKSIHQPSVPSGFDFVAPGSPLFSKGSQQSAPVDTRNVSSSNPKTSPSGNTQTPTQQKGLKIKDVPLPPDIVAYYRKHDPFGGTPSGATKTTDLILAALTVGGGSLEDSVLWLTRKVREQGQNRHGIIAMSYLEGLEFGAIPYPESRPTVAQQNQKLFTDHLYQIPSWAEELYEQMDDTSDDAWLKFRTELVNEALKAGKGDLYESMQYLKKTRLKHSTYHGNAVRPDEVMRDLEENHVGWSAYYYILGLSTYPGLGGKKRK